MASIRSLYIHPSLFTPAIWGLSTGFMASVFTAFPLAIRKANRQAGPEKRMSPGNRWLHRVSGLAAFLPHLYTIVSVPYNGWRFAGWLARFNLPGPPRVGRLADWRNFGFALATLGAAGYVWSIGTLGRSGNFGQLETRPKQTLVDSGPFRIVRSPIYASIMTVHFGFALAMWSWLPFASLSVLIATLVPKLKQEEDALLKSQIGSQYEQYRFRVRYCLLPYVY